LALRKTVLFARIEAIVLVLLTEIANLLVIVSLSASANPLGTVLVGISLSAKNLGLGPAPKAAKPILTGKTAIKVVRPLVNAKALETVSLSGPGNPLESPLVNGSPLATRNPLVTANLLMAKESRLEEKENPSVTGNPLENLLASVSLLGIANLLAEATGNLFGLTDLQVVIVNPSVSAKADQIIAAN
jgi:hypothetical protein